MQTDSDAIILQTQEYREGDLIVSFLTPDHGRLSGIARGARKSRRRFGGNLEPFARLQLHYTLTDDLCPLTGSDTTALHAGLRHDLRRIALAGYACELVTRLLPERMANPRLFRLLAACLDYLDTTDPTPSDRRFFEANLLKILGYAHLGDQCEECGTAMASCQTLSYRPGSFTLLCPACGPARHRISAATALTLRRALASGRFGAIAFPEEQLSEAGAILDSSIAPLLTRPLRSLEFLEEVGAP